MSNYELILGDCLEVMRGLEAGSVQTCITSPPLSDVFTANVLFAMYPMVTDAAKGDDVGDVEAERRIASPRLEVMGTKATIASVGRVTAGATVIVPFIYRPDYFLPRAGSIKPLTFGRTTIDIARVVFARSARHTICLAANPGLLNFGFVAQYLARCGGVGLALKWIDRIGLAHVAIAIRQVVTARSRRYAIAYKPLVDLFRIPADNFGNVIGTHLFNEIFLTQPSLINGLLGFLPFTFAFQRAEASGLITGADDFGVAVFAI